MADMARILADLDGGSRVAKIAFGFIVIGLGLKLAMFPLHTWLPGAYAYSPTPVAAFLASTATKAALYLLLRFTFFVFDPSYAYVADVLMYILVGMGVVGMIFASLQAIFQTDVLDHGGVYRLWTVPHWRAFYSRLCFQSEFDFRRCGCGVVVGCGRHHDYIDFGAYLYRPSFAVGLFHVSARGEWHCRCA